MSRVVIAVVLFAIVVTACGGGADPSPTVTPAATSVPVIPADVDEFASIAESSSLGVSRSELVDHFEELGFVFQDEDFLGILGVAGEVKLSVTGSKKHVSNVILDAPFASTYEGVLVSSYVLELLDLMVPAWEGGASWFEGMIDDIAADPDESTWDIAHPVPGVQVSLDYWPPPPSPRIWLEVAGYDE